MDDSILSRVERSARNYLTVATSYGIHERKEGEKVEKTKTKKSREDAIITSEIGGNKINGKASESVKLPRVLTDSEKANLYLCSELKRISDPFLVFDDSGMEVQDPPDYYSADCLGERICHILSFTSFLFFIKFLCILSSYFLLIFCSLFIFDFSRHFERRKMGREGWKINFFVYFCSY